MQLYTMPRDVQMQRTIIFGNPPMMLFFDKAFNSCYITSSDQASCSLSSEADRSINNQRQGLARAHLRIVRHGHDFQRYGF
ncbi:MAG: hypothetical protein K8T91_00745 [Planctomycetes bacterium]|nr:hypothetical protein [Planctomycetota bacterium]